MDHHLIRSKFDGFDLAVGEPWFLQDALEPIISAIEPLTPMQYPMHSGDPELIEGIKRIYGNKHVVVTNGAKQGISALLYAMEEEFTPPKLYHSQPYWLSHPTLAMLAGYDFASNEGDELKSFIKIVTSPNNPDGKLCADSCDIWDAVYWNSVYGKLGEPPTHRASVWSAAKQFGVSALRVGWILTEDEEIAAKAAHYVEISTSGVNVPGQRQVAGIIRDLIRAPVIATTLYDKARTVLEANRSVFKTALAPFIDEIYAEVGMFAFFKPNNIDKFSESLKNSNIRMVPGEAFGDRYKNWYRANLGNRSKYLHEALNKLLTQLVK